MFSNLRRIGLTWALILVFSVPSGAARAQVNPFMQLAEFVVNVVDHIKWENYDQKFSLCVYGYDSIAVQLLTKKQVNLLKVKELQIIEIKNANIEEFSTCNMIYVADSEEKNLTKVFAISEEGRLLTISSLEGFLSKGGAIEFHLIRGQVKVEINGPLLDRWSVRVSQLLQSFVRYDNP